MEVSNDNVNNDTGDDDFAVDMSDNNHEFVEPMLRLLMNSSIQFQ